MLTVKINSANNFTAVELVKLKSAAVLLEQVVNSQDFKERVLTYPFINTDGLTNQQIYNLIMSGREVLNNAVDNELDIDVTMYYSLRGVIGYTYPNILRTWMNRRFFKKFNAAGVASNLAHEWCHKIGFDHSFYYTNNRKNSVPYAIGYMVEELATQI
jgi:hypothetical protein